MQEVRNPNDPSCDLKNSPFCELGCKFTKWGLIFFICGFILNFGVLIHYIVGSRYNVSNDFLSNVTLWFGSPLTLSSLYLQIGGLGMAILGGAYCMVSHMVAKHEHETTHPHTHRHGSITLCVLGLILLFLTGYVGYFIINAISPGFFYAPMFAAKNWWILLQGISLLVYLIGWLLAFSCICCVCKKCCRTDIHKH